MVVVALYVVAGLTAVAPVAKAIVDAEGDALFKANMKTRPHTTPTPMPVFIPTWSESMNGTCGT